MKKQIMIVILLLGQSITSIYALGQITNNSNTQVNLVFYKGYVKPTDKKSAQGRIGMQGTVITSGQNFNFPEASITSVDIFYGNGTFPPLHTDNINTNSNYTVNPGTVWTLTQD